MLSSLFKCPHATAYHRHGPMAVQRQWFLAHLLHQGFAPVTVRRTANLILEVARRLRLEQRPGEMILVPEVEESAAAWSATLRAPRETSRSKARYQFVWAAKRWLRFLDRLRDPPELPSAYSNELSEYVECMRRDRGLATRTIDQRRWYLRHFLNWVAEHAHSLGELTLEDVDKLLVRKITGGAYARITVRHYATYLRGFFRFAESRKWCRTGLADGIMAPRVFAQEKLPSGPMWEDVQRLLASVAEDKPGQIRNRAILILLAVYGFRAGEVLRLRLEDIDWENEQILLTRPKVSRAQPYPLCRTAADAIVRYLKEVRPRSDFREVFLTLRPPIRPLLNGAIYGIVGPRLRAQGIALPHYGPHALRHACATHLMEEGLSLKEIGDHLGHRHPDTTRIYTKVHITGLRDVGDFDLEGLV